MAAEAGRGCQHTLLLFDSFFPLILSLCPLLSYSRSVNDSMAALAVSYLYLSLSSLLFFLVFFFPGGWQAGKGAREADGCKKEIGSKSAKEKAIKTIYWRNPVEIAKDYMGQSNRSSCSKYQKWSKITFMPKWLANINLGHILVAVNIICLHVLIFKIANIYFIL